jgi:predicted O-linked N-acetylglucosamine transferase (SPINDLY family)
MGFPIVTVDAVRGADASTARTLYGLGFDGGIAKDMDDYVQVALKLMDSPDLLTLPRREARARLGSSFLMNYLERTAELEKSYRLMWLNWLRGDHQVLDAGANIEHFLAQMDALA